MNGVQLHYDAYGDPAAPPVVLLHGTPANASRWAGIATTLADGFRVLETPKGAPYVTLSTKGEGPVTIYGVVLETQGPGVTWETLGVAGSSMQRV